MLRITARTSAKSVNIARHGRATDVLGTVPAVRLSAA
jgi:hypothetical protein